jgi:hypothetical protein
MGCIGIRIVIGIDGFFGHRGSTPHLVALKLREPGGMLRTMGGALCDDCGLHFVGGQWKLAHECSKWAVGPLSQVAESIRVLGPHAQLVCQRRRPMCAKIRHTSVAGTARVRCQMSDVSSKT